MKDFVSVLSSKTMRRTFVYRGVSGNFSTTRMMKRAYWHDEATMLAY